MSSLIGVVTVLYNSASVLEEYFMSLDGQTYRDFIVYVVDNNSPDNSLSIVQTLSGKVSFRTVIICEDTNWGIAKGNNIGIKHALDDGCDLILLSNNDVSFASTTIDGLLKELTATQVGMVVPKIYFHNTSKIWYAGGYFSKVGISTPHIGFLCDDIGQFDLQSEVEYAPTCFLLMRRSLCEKVGLMDEQYFVYYDDSDYLWRAVKKEGYKLLYVPDIQIFHKESTSSGGRESDFTIYYMTRNSLYFARKHYGFFKILKTLILALPRSGAVFLFRRNMKQKWIIVKAIFDSLQLKVSKS